MKKSIKKIGITFLAIALIATFLFSGIASAAAELVKDVYTVSYGVKVNGQSVNIPLLNYQGRTYFPTRTDTWSLPGYNIDYKNGEATFDLVQGNDNNQTINLGNEVVYSDLLKSVVYIYKNGQQIGNGYFYAKDKIILSKTAYNLGSFVIKNYKGETITIKPYQLKSDDRLISVQTTGYESPETLELADAAPKSGEQSNLLCSVAGVPNMVNFSTVKDSFDFNAYTTGDKAYMRSYNNSDISCVGSPAVDSNGKVIGIYFAKGANYSIFVDWDDIGRFLDIL